MFAKHVNKFTDCGSLWQSTTTMTFWHFCVCKRCEQHSTQSIICRKTRVTIEIIDCNATFSCPTNYVCSENESKKRISSSMMNAYSSPMFNVRIAHEYKIIRISVQEMVCPNQVVHIRWFASHGSVALSCSLSLSISHSLCVFALRIASVVQNARVSASQNSYKPQSSTIRLC